VAGRGACGAAWRGAWRPAKAVLEAAGSMCDAWRQLGDVGRRFHGRPSSPECENRGGSVAALRGERMRRQQRGSGSRRSQGGVVASKSAAGWPGARKPAAGAAPPGLRGGWRLKMEWRTGLQFVRSSGA
jgi:hypothetical protein